MSNRAEAIVTEDDRLDPISFEVIRHKLQAITEEQAITLKAVSGSPVVTEATDFNNGLYLADGSMVTMGPQVIFHAGGMSSVIRSIIANFSRNPGIREGDMFILNDPYRGAIHQPDMSIVAPIFCDGVHVAWAGSCSHQLDVGGMGFGSWAFGATEIQQEAMLLPGIKLVEGGELRQDLWQMIMGMTRLPQVLGLDLKAMIAANNVAARRMGELFKKYGLATVQQVMNRELDASEQFLRERLKTLPDGIFRARDYLEHDGHTNKLYRVCVSVEKRGEELFIDMTGTSPQAPGFINCTKSGMTGALLTGILPILAAGSRWNDGVMRAVTITAPDGILCNPIWPAPVSAGTVEGTWIVQNVAVAAFSRLVAASQHMVGEGQAVTKGHMMVLTMAGQNRDGGPFGTFLLDSTAGGGGAFIDHDGLDGSGDYCVPRPCIANVEVTEAAGPYLYLFRGFIPDTGGPGRMRGGVTAGVAVTPHDVDALHAMMIGHGVEVPNSAGLMGGMPGGCGQNLRRAGNEGLATLVAENANALAFKGGKGGYEVLGAKPGHFPLRKGEVIAYTFQGGGGYGDPIGRVTQSVLQDVLDGYVSTTVAEAIYGVVIRDARIDASATAARRKAIRATRLGKAPSVVPAMPSDHAGRPDLHVAEDKHFHCSCGADLGRADGDWKSHAHCRTLAPEEAGPYIRLHEDLELREFACASCATLLEVEVVRKDEPSLINMQLKI
jgi:N-methylhydantoinase B